MLAPHASHERSEEIEESDNAEYYNETTEREIPRTMCHHNDKNECFGENKIQLAHT